MTVRWTPFEIITGAGAAFLGIAFACVSLEAGRIETGLATRAATALDDAGLYWFAVQPSGRRLIITGAAADAEAAGTAAGAVAAVPGVGSVENRIGVIGTAGACQRQVDAAQDRQPVTFRRGIDEITPASEPVIAAVAETVRRCGVRVEVAVHADGGGNPSLGLSLSQRRADQVARRLARHGVPADRVVATGYGMTQPVAGSAGTTARSTAAVPDAADDAGRALGQRVEFRMLGAAT